MRVTDAAVDDVGVDARAGVGVVVLRVEREIALVNAV
jgi:hypothetical protein